MRIFLTDYTSISTIYRARMKMNTRIPSAALAVTCPVSLKGRRLVFSNRLAPVVLTILQDSLMSQAILLWDITHMLTSPTPSFETYYSPHPIFNSSEISMLTPLPLQQPDPTSPTDTSDISSSSILATYLFSRFEKCASSICSSVLNDLEKRLLRGRLQAFGIFLVAFLLFACVERMEWLVRTFESPEKQDQV